ncbi:hypothetical protein [Actinomycetospora termitidis]|uniref:Uncharacterized protein n=1 Tax=Actinomycetospora termitidis TaxID=3053470 RepID=A0ABT7M773_9PSEU|nr:hypothetical protein [Actinomycetospora sp. Odt1-22]MDL5156296.1 hypothetical protein [Actinomycetospora sp. Odt1-22]
MSGTWDAGAVAWLREMRDRWRAVGVLGLLEDAVAAVWERNVARHDPRVAGDTALTLGLTSSENLRSRLLAAAPEWAERDVRIAAPWNSLVLSHREVALHLMKAPPAHDPQPDWAVLRWPGEVRGAAAAANGAGYVPLGGQLTFDGVPAPRRPHEQPAGLRHAVLVWTGDPVTATTSGWLAVPWEGAGGADPPERFWLAVTPVWRHGPDDVPAPPRVPAVSIPFSVLGDDAGR